MRLEVMVGSGISYFVAHPVIATLNMKKRKPFTPSQIETVPHQITPDR